MSRVFTIKELNEKIDDMIAELKAELGDSIVFPAVIISGKIEILEELKLELNSPEPIVNVTEKVQESLNVIQTKKIINDELQ